MSTLKTHNLQSPDAASANIALTPNSGMVVAGISTLGIGAAGGVDLLHQNVSRLSTQSYGIAVNGNILLQEELVHIGDTDTRIKFPAADTITAETAGSERIRIDSSGRVGIGTNNPDQELTLWSNSPAIKLVDTDPYEEGAYGTIAQSGGVLQLVADSGNTSGHGSIFFYSYNDNDSFNTYRISDNLHQWYISGEEKLRLSSTGYLGIGTVTPSTRLDVYDTSGLGILSRSATTQATDSNKALKVRNNSTTDTFNVSYKGQGFFAGNVGINTDDITEQLVIYKGVGGNPSGNATFRMRSDTSSTHMHLDARGTNASSMIYFRSGTAYDAFLQLKHNYSGDHYLRYCHNGSAAETFRIHSTGALGLGGANYGTAGQVLKSNGSSAVPSWSGGAQRVLEVVASPCDGSTISSSNGDVTFQNVTGVQNLSTTFTDVTGSKITYTPPTGTTQVIYEFNFQMSRLDALAISHYRMYIAGNEVTYARSEIAAEDGCVRTTIRWIFNIGGSQNNATGRQSSWTSGKEIKLQAEDYGGSYDVQLHETNWWNGAGTDQFSMPTLSLTAIGV